MADEQTDRRRTIHGRVGTNPLQQHPYGRFPEGRHLHLPEPAECRWNEPLALARLSLLPSHAAEDDGAAAQHDLLVERGKPLCEPAHWKRGKPDSPQDRKSERKPGGRLEEGRSEGTREGKEGKETAHPRAHPSLGSG